MVRRSSTQMINSDPPEHGRRRSLVNASFLPRRIEQLRPRIQAVADQLLDRLADRREMDLVSDYAFPLPMAIISDIVGIRPDDGPRVKRWADDVSNFLASGHVGADQVAAYLQSWSELSSYFTDRAAELAGSGGEDVVSQLALKHEAGEASLEEVISNLVLLAVAGHETTTNTIAVGLSWLMRRPDEMARLRADPSLIATAVDELLRYEATSQWDFRIATEDVTIGDQRIGAGELVDFVLAAANRDPEQFPDPDRLDVARTPNRHVTFGLGPHFCLGAQLARMELQIAIGSFVARFDRLELVDDELDWKPNVRMRGLRSLRIRYEPTGGSNASRPMAT
jgi:cytochrome P450